MNIKMHKAAEMRGVGDMKGQEEMVGQEEPQELEELQGIAGLQELEELQGIEGLQELEEMRGIKEKQRQAGINMLKALREAVEQGKKSFSILPGVYRFYDNSPFLLENAKDMKIDGSQVLIIKEGTQGKAPGFHMKNCQRVIVKGITFESDPLPFSQGTITEINQDSPFIEVIIDEGYEIPENDKIPCRAIYWNEEQTQLLPTHCNDTVSSFLRTGERSVRFTHLKGGLFRKNTPIKVGHKVVFPFRSGEPMVCLTGCLDCVIQDLSIYSCPGFGIGEYNGEGGTIYSRVKIIPKPNSGRLLSVSADGFHAYQVLKGPTIENCEISHTQDDLVNIHDFFAVVVEQESANVLRLLVPYAYEKSIMEGFRLNVYYMKSLMPRSWAIIKKVEFLEFNEGDSQETRNHNEECFDQRYKNSSGKQVEQEFKNRGMFVRDMSQGGEVRVTLDRDVSCDYIDICEFDHLERTGAVIRDSYFHHGFVRGIMLRVPRSLVENNRIEHVLGPGIFLNAERWWLEGPFPRDIKISGNKVLGCGASYNGERDVSGGILVLTEPADRPEGRFFNQHYENITISHNQIVDSGFCGMLLMNIKNANVTHNTIISPWALGKREDAGAHLGIDQPFGAIVLASHENVIISNNAFEKLPEFLLEVKEY